MLFDELAEPSKLLLRARSRAFGDDLTALAREHANLSSVELADALHDAPRDQRAQVGLLLARVALEEAMSTRSRELFERFLFRFAAHLKASVSVPGLTPGQRLTLATAAEKAFDVLPTSSSSQRADAASIRSRLAAATSTDADWQATVGVSQNEFFTILDRFQQELGGKRRTRAKATSISRREMPKVVRDKSRVVNPAPAWLTLPFEGSPDAHLASTANWDSSAVTPRDPASASGAWLAFQEGDYSAARDQLGDLLRTAGLGEGPPSGVDALRTWNWVRLVVELAAIDTSQASDSRRSLTSACIFLQRCLPDEQFKLEEYARGAIGDMVMGDIASRRAVSAYSSRLVLALGHEMALSGFTNSAKAELRVAWGEQYQLDSDDSRSTASAAAEPAPVSRTVLFC